MIINLTKLLDIKERRRSTDYSQPLHPRNTTGGGVLIYPSTTADPSPYAFELEKESFDLIRGDNEMDDDLRAQILINRQGEM